MIFKFDFKHQLKLPTLVHPKLHFSLNRTVRHEVIGFFQTKHISTYMKKGQMFYIRCHNRFQMRTKKYKQSQTQQLNKQKHRQKLKKKQQAWKTWSLQSSTLNRCYDVFVPVPVLCERTGVSLITVTSIVRNNEKCGLCRRFCRYNAWLLMTTGVISSAESRRRWWLGAGVCHPPKMGRPQLRFYCCLRYYFVYIKNFVYFPCDISAKCPRGWTHKRRTQFHLSNSKTESPLSVISEAANQRGEPLTPSCVMSLHTKCGAVAKLIGKKAFIQCNLNSLVVKTLLDTGARVSIISHDWKDKYLPDFVMRPLSEIVEEKDKLKVCTVNGESIPFKGWLPIMINLAGSEDTNLSISTPCQQLVYWQAIDWV